MQLSHTERTEHTVAKPHRSAVGDRSVFCNEYTAKGAIPASCSESEVDFEEMHVHTGFVGTVCASIRAMLEAVLCKESRNEIKTGTDGAGDLDRASKVLASEFVVAEEGRPSPHVN